MNYKTQLLLILSRINTLRGDMTVYEFAQKIGISSQTVGIWFRGDREPSAVDILTICQKCGCSADYLLGLSEVQNMERE